MTGIQNETIHATAVLVGARAVVIRGPSGSGKSHLALRLMQGEGGAVAPFVRLVADDRVAIAPSGGRLLLRPVPVGAGLIEIRGIGLVRVAHEPVAVAGFVLDLTDPAAERMPEPRAGRITLAAVELPRLSVPPGCDPLPQLRAFLAGARGHGEEYRPNLPGLNQLGR